MSEKVFLILGDAMRPDSLEACGHPFVEKLLAESISFMNAKTVVPSVTLPCHLSLFHSVPPKEHGILSNTFVPQVKKIDGLVEQINRAGKKAAIFYSWEKLRDIYTTEVLAYSYFLSTAKYGVVSSDLTQKALKIVKERSPDFVFLYLGESDGAGHKYGHMTDGYLKAVHNVWDYIEQVYMEVADDYSIIVTADHGGHDRTHGTDMHEDVTIPIIIKTPYISTKKVDKPKLIDIAPTIATLMGIEKGTGWEGTSLV